MNLAVYEINLEDGYFIIKVETEKMPLTIPIKFIVNIGNAYLNLKFKEEIEEYENYLPPFNG